MEKEDENEELHEANPWNEGPDPEALQEGGKCWHEQVLTTKG